ncbi:MAG: hypothetical protein IRZ16_13995 [Myxococcaceae bacterium]|nr:hypothetical protein [Myxococcaceae bacterium]
MMDQVELFERFLTLPGFAGRFRVPARAELRTGIAAHVGPHMQPSTLSRWRPQIAPPPGRILRKKA